MDPGDHFAGVHVFPRTLATTMTRKLDLRTGVSVWEAYRAPRIPTQKLT